METALV